MFVFTLKRKKKKTLIIVHSCVLSHFSNAWLFVTLWAVACQAPLSMGFSRQECWSGLPCPPPGDLPDPRIEPEALMSPASAGRFFTTSTTWEALTTTVFCNKKKILKMQTSVLFKTHSHRSPEIILNYIRLQSNAFKQFNSGNSA